MKFSTSDPKKILAAIKAAKTACAKNGFRPILEHVELSVQDITLTITALNGFYLVQKTCAVMDAENGTCVVHPDYLIRILSGESEFANFTVNGDFLEVETGMGRSAIKLVEGEFIRHKEIFPKEPREYKISFNPGYMIRVLRALEKKDGRAVTMHLDPESNAESIFITMALDADADKALLLPVRIFK